jgi:hypothetical protein
MKTPTIVLAVLATVLSAPVLALDERLSDVPAPVAIVNLDSSDVLQKGALFLRSEARMFGGDEDLTYVGFGARYGLGKGFEGSLRGVFSNKRDLNIGGGNVIGHGGNDWELSLKARLSEMTTPISVILGLSFADTPAQCDKFLTLGAAASRSLSDRIEVTANPRAIFIEDNTIVGFGLGASAKISDNLSFGLDYTPILTGRNTRSVTTGDMMACDLYGAMLRYSMRGGNANLTVGYTNATGGTTGFGLTPGLGGSGAWVFGASMRY